MFLLLFVFEMASELRLFLVCKKCFIYDYSDNKCGTITKQFILYCVNEVVWLPNMALYRFMIRNDRALLTCRTAVIIELQTVDVLRL